MATGRVPRKDSEFDQYIRNTQTLLSSGTPTGAERLGLTTTQATDWAGFYTNWIAVYPTYTNPATRTTAITNQKNQIKQDFTAFAELPLKQIEVSPSLTTEDRLTFNLKERDRTPTVRGPITDVPIVGIAALGGGKIQFKVRQTTDSTRASKHPLADGVEVRYLMTEARPKDPDPGTPDQIPTVDKAIGFNLSPKAMFTIDLGSSFTGLYLVAFVRWVNTTTPANSGPWTVPQLVLIV